MIKLGGHKTPIQNFHFFDESPFQSSNWLMSYCGYVDLCVFCFSSNLQLLCNMSCHRSCEGGLIISLIIYLVETHVGDSKEPNI